MNKTIHELNALVSLANDDELIVYDVATGTSKKIKKSDLKNQLAGDLITDTVQDGNSKGATSNAVYNNCVIKKDYSLQEVSGDDPIENIKSLVNQVLTDNPFSAISSFVGAGEYWRLGYSWGSYLLQIFRQPNGTLPSGFELNVNGFVITYDNTRTIRHYYKVCLTNDNNSDVWDIQDLTPVDAVADGNMRPVTSNALFDRLNVSSKVRVELPAYESTIGGGETHELGSYTVPETGVYAIDWNCYAINNTNGGTSIGIKITNYNVEDLAINSFFQGATDWANCLICSSTRKLTKNDVIKFYFMDANPSQCNASTVFITRII